MTTSRARPAAPTSPSPTARVVARPVQGAVQHAGGGPEHQPVVVLDPDEGQTIWHQLGGRPTGSGQHVAQPERGGHRAGHARQKAPVERHAGARHVPQQPHRSPPRRQDDIRRPGVDSTRGAPPGRNPGRRSHAERRRPVLHADRSATWAPRSSRSSDRAAVTMPARGRRRAGATRAPRSWRSTATSAASPLDLKREGGLEVLRRLVAPRRRLRAEPAAPAPSASWDSTSPRPSRSIRGSSTARSPPSARAARSRTCRATTR